MTTRKEIAEILRSLPTDDTWLPLLMTRLKEDHPAVFRSLILSAREKRKELEK
jgi:hypothetical protein